MSSHSVDSSGPNGLSVTTTSTVSPVIGSNLLYASSASLSMWWNLSVRSSRKAGCSRRISLSRPKNGSSDSPLANAASKSRGRNSYFSESRYSSLPSRTGRYSKSS